MAKVYGASGGGSQNTSNNGNIPPKKTIVKNNDKNINISNEKYSGFSKDDIKGIINIVNIKLAETSYKGILSNIYKEIAKEAEQALNEFYPSDDFNAANIKNNNQNPPPPPPPAAGATSA